MKKSLLSLLVAFGIGTFTSGVIANPLPDGAFMAQKAGWFPSIATPCPQICEKQGARAENEDYVAAVNGVVTVKKTFVCKINARNAKGELYGNNFYDNQLLKNQCRAVDHLGNVFNDRSFKCLCVKVSNITPVEPPEPPFAPAAPVENL